MEESRSRKPLMAALVGGGIGLLLLLAGSFLGGTLFGYELGTRAQFPGDSPSTSGSPRTMEQRFAGEWRGDVEGKISGSVRLNIIENGKLSGNDGCNSGGGSWTIEGPELRFEDLFSTEIYCANVKTYLFEARGARLSADGGQLILLSDGGQTIGTLTRTSSGLNR